MELEFITGEIIASAIRVHTALGPGLLESVYESCLAHELRLRGMRVRNQIPLPVVYRGVRILVAYRVDLLVEESVIVELKAVTKIHPIHQAQVLSYLRLSGLHVGLLINFHELHLKDGITRLVRPR